MPGLKNLMVVGGKAQQALKKKKEHRFDSGPGKVTCSHEAATKAKPA